MNYFMIKCVCRTHFVGVGHPIVNLPVYLVRAVEVASPYKIISQQIQICQNNYTTHKTKSNSENAVA